MSNISGRHGCRWSREETIIVLALYYRILFAKSSREHPEIKRIAKIIERTPDSVNMKIGNFRSFDPELKEKRIVGLTNTTKLDSMIWHEFVNNKERLFTLAAEFEKETLDKKRTFAR